VCGGAGTVGVDARRLTLLLSRSKWVTVGVAVGAMVETNKVASAMP